jgi:hypothetical protein
MMKKIFRKISRSVRYPSGASSSYPYLLYELRRTILGHLFLGNLLIIMAQIIVAIQMVTEQKFLLQYDVPPLLAVGLEGDYFRLNFVKFLFIIGLFGLTILSILMVPMYFIHVPATFSKNPFHRLEDIIYAFKEMRDQPIVIVALMLTVVSIAFFNFAGIVITLFMTRFI